MTAETPSSYFDTSKEAQSRRGRRSKGSRAKLAQRFFEDTYAAWEEQGPSVLARAAFHDPVAFANMVARLMPQKIEVSTPTDGMSDERLAELLDFAERMAGLKAEQAKVLQGEVISAALPPPAQALQPASAPPHKLADENGLSLDAAEAGGGGRCAEMGVGGENTSSTLRADPAETTSPEFKPLNVLPPGPVLNGDEQKSHNPYPVGRAVPLRDHEVEKQNRYKLHDDGDVDHASLF